MPPAAAPKPPSALTISPIAGPRLSSIWLAIAPTWKPNPPKKVTIASLLLLSSPKVFSSSLTIGSSKGFPASRERISKISLMLELIPATDRAAMALESTNGSSRFRISSTAFPCARHWRTMALLIPRDLARRLSSVISALTREPNSWPTSSRRIPITPIAAVIDLAKGIEDSMALRYSLDCPVIAATLERTVLKTPFTSALVTPTRDMVSSSNCFKASFREEAVARTDSAPSSSRPLRMTLEVAARLAWVLRISWLSRSFAPIVAS